MTYCYIKLEDKVLECDTGIVQRYCIRSIGITRVELTGAFLSMKQFSAPVSNRVSVGKVLEPRFWRMSIVKSH